MGALVHALSITGSMTWETTWALILGFALSAVIQAVVRRSTVVRLLGGHRPRTLAVAAGLGAASSSCSYAAVALAPILDIYRKYYGARMAAFLLGTFFAAMAAAGYVIELVFGGLALTVMITDTRAAVVNRTVSCEYSLSVPTDSDWRAGRSEEMTPSGGALRRPPE